MALAKSNPTEVRYKVGTRVRFRFGFTQLVGRIVEDRGLLGVGGRRLYGIKFFEDEDEPRYTELSADEFQPVEN